MARVESTDPARTRTSVRFGALVIGGIEGLLFGMLPLSGLPGAKVKEWDTRVWAPLLFLGSALFLHIIVNPSSG